MAKVMRARHDQGRRRGRSSVQSCFKNTLPAWEKEFCTKVGQFSWSKFLEAKKYVDIYPRVMLWNDEAGAEAFKAAKKRFKAHYLGLPCDHISVPSPDDCIDVVDWDSEVDPSLLEGMDRVSFDDESAISNATDHRVVEELPIEAIQPTGWDVDVDVDRDPLVGMIVGD